MLLFSLLRFFGVIAFSLIFFSATLFAQEKSVEELIERQNQLEKKIEQLENHIKQTETASDDTQQTDRKAEVSLQEDVDEISDRLDTIETKSILDKIKLGGEFRTWVETIRYTDHTFNGTKTNGESEEIWSNRLRLTLRSDIRDNIVFHSRLAYFKLWGHFTNDSLISDWNYPGTPNQEGNLHVERAYIDYFVPNTSISLTFGRLPTGDGPPDDLKDNTTRKSTWPVLMNDVEVDGIIASSVLDQWTGLKKNMFRIAYTKFQQHFLRYKETRQNFDDVRGWVVAFETQVPRLNDSLFWLSYGMMDMAPMKDYEGIISYPKNTGYSDFYTCHLQFNDFFQTGLDWFGAFTHVYIDTKPTGTLFENGYEVSIYSDNIHGTIGDSFKGHGVYTGVRYKLPISFLKQPRIGLEYNYGSKYWLGILTSGSGDLVNKLDTHGHAFEFYYLQPIHEKTMFARLGFVYTNHHYSNAIFGEPVKSDMNTTDTYLLVDIRF